MEELPKSKQLWKCTKCTFANKKERKRCQMCLSYPSPGTYKSYNEWSEKDELDEYKVQILSQVDSFIDDDDDVVEKKTSTTTTNKATSTKLSDSSSSGSTIPNDSNAPGQLGLIEADQCAPRGFTTAAAVVVKSENQTFLRDPLTSFLNVLARVATLTHNKFLDEEDEIVEASAIFEAPHTSAPNTPPPLHLQQYHHEHYKHFSTTETNNNKPNNNTTVISKTTSKKSRKQIMQPGKLIRYGFENSEGSNEEWLWFVGVVSSEAKHNSYYEVSSSV
jgi:hypothetical protein